MSAKADFERFKPIYRAQLVKRLARFPRSLKGVRRLQLRNPTRYMEFQTMQRMLHALITKA